MRRGPKREEENARMEAMEMKKKMETAAVRKRRRGRGGEGDARVAGVVMYCRRMEARVAREL